jgi:hypothetical protein
MVTLLRSLMYEHGSKMAVYFLLSDRGEIGLDAEGVVFW